MIKVNLWLIENKPIIFIGVNLWTNTLRNIESQRCENNTRRYAMNTKMTSLQETNVWYVPLDASGMQWIDQLYHKFGM